MKRPASLLAGLFFEERSWTAERGRFLSAWNRSRSDRRAAAAGFGGNVRLLDRSVRSGSPQPPPGGGLHSCVPQVRSCWPVRSAAGWSRVCDGPSGPSGPQPPRWRRAAFRVSQVRLCRLVRLVAGWFRIWIGPSGPSGPQPPGSGGPQFVAEAACTPQAASRIGIYAQACSINLFNFES